jgi:hypothetical protein
VAFKEFTMFGMYEDRRTAEERKRDFELQDKRRGEKFLALGFLKNTVRPLLKDSGADVGLAGEGSYSGAELLVEVDGVTYKLQASVDHHE